MLKFAPSVFAVEKNYIIIAVTERPAIVTVEVQGVVYQDAVAGVVCSMGNIRKIAVPQAALNTAGGYTVTVQNVIERKTYFPEFETPVCKSFTFYPLPTNRAIRAYMLADTHNRFDEPVAAAKKFGVMDLLLLNGDIVDPCYSEEKVSQMYALTGELTKGGIPIIYARGNHDMRGCYAERLSLHTPNVNNGYYYTTQLGNLWMLVLDCGEDKIDDIPEYSGTVNCHPYRLQQTEFLKRLIGNASQEYAAPGITHRLVLCHIPFNLKYPDNNQGETAVYAEWNRLLREYVHPDLLLFGHAHEFAVCRPGDPQDLFGLPCTAAVGSRINEKTWGGTGLLLEPTQITATFTESLTQTKQSFTVKMPNCNK